MSTWRYIPDEDLSSADITAMCSEGNPVNVAGPPRAATVFKCHRDNAVVTGMGFQSVMCCGEPMERVA